MPSAWRDQAAEKAPSAVSLRKSQTRVHLIFASIVNFLRALHLAPFGRPEKRDLSASSVVLLFHGDAARG
jgi:hypothetical protein